MTSLLIRASYRAAIVAAVVTLNAMPALAQQARSVDSEHISVVGGLDVRNAYMLRGVRQDDTGTITWPFLPTKLHIE